MIVGSVVWIVIPCQESRQSFSRPAMPNPADKLTPADPRDLADGARPIRSAAKRVHNADEIMAEIVAKRLVERPRAGRLRRHETSGDRGRRCARAGIRGTIAHRIGFCVAFLRRPPLSYHIHEPTPHAALAVASRRRLTWRGDAGDGGALSQPFAIRRRPPRPQARPQRRRDHGREWRSASSNIWSAPASSSCNARRSGAAQRSGAASRGDHCWNDLVIIRDAGAVANPTIAAVARPASGECRIQRLS